MLCMHFFMFDLHETLMPLNVPFFAYYPHTVIFSVINSHLLGFM